MKTLHSARVSIGSYMRIDRGEFLKLAQQVERHKNSRVRIHLALFSDDCGALVAEWHEDKEGGETDALADD